MRTGEKEKQRKRARRAKTESESGNVDEGAGGATGGTSGPRDKVARHTALLGESRLRPDHISCRRFSRPVQTRASEPTHSYSPHNLSTESRTVISPPLPPPIPSYPLHGPLSPPKLEAKLSKSRRRRQPHAANSYPQTAQTSRIFPASSHPFVLCSVSHIHILFFITYYLSILFGSTVCISSNLSTPLIRVTHLRSSTSPKFPHPQHLIHLIRITNLRPFTTYSQHPSHIIYYTSSPSPISPHPQRFIHITYRISTHHPIYFTYLISLHLTCITYITSATVPHLLHFIHYISPT